MLACLLTEVPSVRSRSFDDADDDSIDAIDNFRIRTTLSKVAELIERISEHLDFNNVGGRPVLTG